MAIDPNNFWDATYYHHPPLTPAMVASIENDFGISLPQAFIDLLQIQNGGYTKGFGFPMSQKTSWADNHVPLHDLNGIVVDQNIETPLRLTESSSLADFGLPPKQVLLSGDGHYWITLDYRHSETPSVSWIDVECDEDVSVAPTFETFLEGLRPEEEFNFE